MAGPRSPFPLDRGSHRWPRGSGAAGTPERTSHSPSLTEWLWPPEGTESPVVCVAGPVHDLSEQAAAHHFQTPARQLDSAAHPSELAVATMESRPWTNRSDPLEVAPLTQFPLEGALEEASDARSADFTTMCELSPLATGRLNVVDRAEEASGAELSDESLPLAPTGLPFTIYEDPPDRTS